MWKYEGFTIFVPPPLFMKKLKVKKKPCENAKVSLFSAPSSIYEKNCYKLVGNVWEYEGLTIFGPLLHLWKNNFEIIRNVCKCQGFTIFGFPRPFMKKLFKSWQVNVLKYEGLTIFLPPPSFMKKLIKSWLEICENTKVSLFWVPLLHSWKKIKVKEKCVKIRRFHYFRIPPSIYEEINWKLILFWKPFQLNMRVFKICDYILN